MAEAPRAIRSLFVTLKRSHARKPWFHRAVLENLGLLKRHRTMEHPNNAGVRGMLRKVAHLVLIETDAMYEARMRQEAATAANRPPIVVMHAHPEVIAALAARMQAQPQPPQPGEDPPPPQQATQVQAQN